MPASVADIINVMGVIAPVSLAEDWDNVGLQVGQMEWPVKTVWIALDPSPDIVAAACQKKVNLLITHHPLIFRALKSVHFDSPAGSAIFMAAKHRVAIFAAHTNYDNAVEGLNDTLARRIGLSNLKVLDTSGNSQIYKLVVYVPAEFVHEFIKILNETQVGNYGQHSDGAFISVGKDATNLEPFTATVRKSAGEFLQADTIRFETLVHHGDLNGIIEHLKRCQPYKTMAYDIYPLVRSNRKWGLGRVGELAKSADLRSFAMHIKKKLGLATVKIAGDLSLPINKAAVCTGSGSSLMKYFFDSEAQVFVSGDLRYHDAKDAVSANRGLIDIGHFASEHLIVDILAERLSRLLTDKGLNVKVEACKLERDPFVII
ncbi:MAG: Nif3-like dinuclear metal center hexameric protein [Deltaproteobacteria bacterium]|nr:MAG: Nif3-like dinuclear metal center hexameric protein [Deltaproteobacteria bacterium]